MNRKMILFLIILVSICAVSHVSAEDASDIVLSDDSDAQIQAIDETDMEESTMDDGSSPIGFEQINEDTRDLQGKIDNAPEGETIKLEKNYTINAVVTINKKLTIESEGDGISITGDEESNITTALIYVNASDVCLKNIKFTGGVFKFSACIFWQGDNGTITDCLFKDNTVKGNESIGGAVLIIGNNCNVTNSKFINNHADLSGGAILVNATGTTINNCEFIGNDAGGYGDVSHGGAILLFGNDNTVKNSNFTKNHCIDYGGAISVLGENNRIIKCNFDENYVSSDTAKKVQGGGAVMDYLNSTIDYCNFNNNYASKSYGGAISAAEYTIINHSFFKGNLASLGNDIIYANYQLVTNNHFVLDYKERENEAFYGGTREEVKAALNVTNNQFEMTKMGSEVQFSAGMVFEYGTSGSIFVSVEGGEVGTYQVLDHPEAQIGYSNGLMTVQGLNVGKYTLRVTSNPDEDHNPAYGDLSITVNKANADIKASKATVALKKGYNWEITIVDHKSGKGIANMEVTLKVYTGSKFKTVTLRTDANGRVKYKTSSLTKGNHKIVVSASHPGYNLASLSSSIKVVKQTALKFKVKKQTLQKGSSLSITVMNKKTKKPINGVKIKLLIYTGSKLTKTVVLKTKKNGKYKGVAGYFTNALKVGNHKVKIEPYDIKYSGLAKSSMKITKKHKKYPASTFKISAKV